MRAVLATSLGGPDSLELAEVPDPRPAPGEVVARVLAAGVNHADLLMTRGLYQVRPELPFTPGLEFAGVVIAVGEGVSGLNPGDRVIGAPPHGCFAELVCARASRVFPWPQAMPLELAAGLLIGHGTAAFALGRADLQAGETLLVTGAGGGVSLAAIEIGVRKGARVIAAASSAAKLALATAHGAAWTVNLGERPLREAVREITSGRGADVVLETVGGEVFDAALRATARWARVLAVGFASGGLPRIPAEYLLIKNLTVSGVGFGAMLEEVPSRVQAVIDELAALHARQPFAACAGGRFSLAEAPDALRRLADRTAAGKLLVVPG